MVFRDLIPTNSKNRSLSIYEMVELVAFPCVKRFVLLVLWSRVGSQMPPINSFLETPLLYSYTIFIQLTVSLQDLTLAVLYSLSQLLYLFISFLLSSLIHHTIPNSLPSYVPIFVLWKRYASGCLFLHLFSVNPSLQDVRV